MSDDKLSNPPLITYGATCIACKGSGGVNAVCERCRGMGRVMVTVPKHLVGSPLAEDASQRWGTWGT